MWIVDGGVGHTGIMEKWHRRTEGRRTRERPGEPEVKSNQRQ